MPETTTVLKPGISTETTYAPVGSDGTVNSPMVSVVTVRVSPVFWFLTITCAPGTMAPLVSATVPRMVPVTACADAGRGRERKRRESANGARGTVLPRDA